MPTRRQLAHLLKGKAVPSHAARIGMPKRSKYGNVKIVIDGVKFDSRKEGERYGWLKIMERQGKISNLELQPIFPIVIHGRKCFKYIADFSYLRDGQQVVEDVKSVSTRKNRAYRIKVKVVEAWLGIKIVEV
jgi:hypothetical protein